MPARGHGAAGQRGRRRRLARSADFDRVIRRGRSHASRWLVVHAFPRPPEGERAVGEAGGDPSDRPTPAAGAASSSAGEALPRLGVSVGRRVGGAVERNRVKRLLREAFWAVAPELPGGHDFVLVARPAAADLARREGERGVEAALRDLLTDAGLRGGEAERA